MTIHSPKFEVENGYYAIEGQNYTHRGVLIGSKNEWGTAETNRAYTMAEVVRQMGDEYESYAQWRVDYINRDAGTVVDVTALVQEELDELAAENEREYDNSYEQERISDYRFAVMGV